MSLSFLPELFESQKNDLKNAGQHHRTNHRSETTNCGGYLNTKDLTHLARTCKSLLFSIDPCYETVKVVSKEAFSFDNIISIRSQASKCNISTISNEHRQEAKANKADGPHGHGAHKDVVRSDPY
ncbi:hypothetical protein PAAG_11677 [Paracoccidioides lutzii Pb01]|uniref:Uncharacterized protein n=1 Tax=Paracoccidioides lutzii (strain ATCC MYA-826 / Pb01) TaxID=502779 RepID=A0A0A2V230_PARBA|nr:hypothetical protein PAAG_11677 [Paracoccidioides lutzii Pb01]KGQ01553.1 hypothetical protein PAAG_11677 [Paracoccidioides lutzii Pb01]